MPDPKIRQISKHKVLYVDLDEEITSIFDRIQRLNSKEVFLLIPERAVLLQSVVNLQILKRKVADLDKMLSIITRDPVGSKLALKANIPVFDEMNSPKVAVKKSEKEMSDTLEPMAALSNSIEEESPERLSEKKLSIFDIVQRNKKGSSFSFHRLKHLFRAYRKDREFFKEPSRFALGAPSRKTLGTLVVASLSILFVISYIALPGAKITITPQSNVMEQSVNVTLAEVNRYGTNFSIDNTHTVPSYPIQITLEESLDYTSTGQIFDGTNATGTVTFINERDTSWQLVAFTRIQTEEGLIFRTQEPVTVPAANSNGFGTVKAVIIADEVDAYDRVIGERGNIAPSSFILPGLRESSQKVLYARSDEPTTGGSTVVTLKITQEDLEAADLLMREKLENSAVSALEKAIAEQNQTNGTDLELLTGYGAIELGEPTVNVPSQLVEAIQDQFQVAGSMRVSGIAYDHSDLVDILKQELDHRKSPDKSLIKIDENSITHEIIALNQTPGQVKITANIKGIEAYLLDPSDENGSKLVKKIKEHVAGKSIKEAEDYIQNLPEVNKVKISSWPVWAPTIPTVFENIEIRMDEDWLEGMEK